WSAPMTFTTVTVIEAPWHEEFAGHASPAGWRLGEWVLGTTGLDGLSGNYIYQNLYWSSPESERTFITPAIGTVQSGQWFSFQYQLTDYDDPDSPPTAGSGDFRVAISTDFGITYTNVATVENDGSEGP